MDSCFKFEASQGYIVSSRLAWTNSKHLVSNIPLSKKEKKEKTTLRKVVQSDIVKPLLKLLLDVGDIVKSKMVDQGDQMR